MRRICYILIAFVIFTGRLWVERLISFSQPIANLVPGERVRITELIPETPYQSESTQRFRIRGITVIAPRYPSYSYGDLVQIEGEIRRNAVTERSEVLKQGGEGLVMMYPNISLLGEDERGSFPQGKGFLWLQRLVINIRKTIVGLFRRVYGEPHGSLMAGIVVGERANMPPSFHAALKNSGTVHVIAVSGMNIAIVAGALLELLVRFLSRRRAAVGAVIGIWFYALLAGLSAPVVRAAIMGTIAFMALVLGREKDAGRALIATGGLMLLWNPYYLFDIGWQLSFAATAGIIWVQPILKRRFNVIASGAKQSPTRLPRRSDKTSELLAMTISLGKWIGDELSVTLAAYGATLPLLVYHFGQISWIAPMANIMIAPVVGVLTMGGLGLALVGLIWSGLAELIGLGLWPFLEYFVRIVEWLGRYEAIKI